MTFPFLFGVMFGDMGHGFCLFSFGCYLVFKCKSIMKDQNSLSAKILPHRFLILFMGFFAIYCGCIYNEFFGISINFFGSCYNVH